MKFHFITYGDINFEKSKKRILKEAADFQEFETMKGYGPEDISKDFKEKYRDILSMSRGGGFFNYFLLFIKYK